LKTKHFAAEPDAVKPSLKPTASKNAKWRAQRTLEENMTKKKFHEEKTGIKRAWGTHSPRNARRQHQRRSGSGAAYDEIRT